VENVDIHKVGGGGGWLIFVLPVLAASHLPCCVVICWVSYHFATAPGCVFPQSPLLV
jgi:hypothetical protein